MMSEEGGKLKRKVATFQSAREEERDVICSIADSMAAAAAEASGSALEAKAAVASQLDAETCSVQSLRQCGAGVLIIGPSRAADPHAAAAVRLRREDSAAELIAYCWEATVEGREASSEAG